MDRSIPDSLKSASSGPKSPLRVLCLFTGFFQLEDDCSAQIAFSMITDRTFSVWPESWTGEWDSLPDQLVADHGVSAPLLA